MRPEPGWLEIGAMGAHLAFGTTCVAVGLAARTGHLRFLAWCTAATSAALAYAILEFGKPGLGLTRLSGGLMVAFFLSISWDAGWLPPKRATVKLVRPPGWDEDEARGLARSGLQLNGRELRCANQSCGALVGTLLREPAGASGITATFKLAEGQTAQVEGKPARCLRCGGRQLTPERISAGVTHRPKRG